jgi:hypothetical protein
MARNKTVKPQMPAAFTYHPRTADQLDISPMPDGLGVLIGIYNNQDNGQYTTIEVAIPDVETVVGALRAAKMQAQETAQ